LHIASLIAHATHRDPHVEIRKCAPWTTDAAV
jgi:hypothetical protein